MKINAFFPVLIFLLLSACTTKEKIVPPMAKKVPKELTIHGHTRVDNYYWLNERENPEVIKYLEDENITKGTKPVKNMLCIAGKKGISMPRRKLC